MNKNVLISLMVLISISSCSAANPQQDIAHFNQAVQQVEQSIRFHQNEINRLRAELTMWTEFHIDLDEKFPSPDGPGFYITKRQILESLADDIVAAEQRLEQAQEAYAALAQDPRFDEGYSDTDSE